METIIVTRHPGLLEYLKEIGLVGDGVRVIAHATPYEVGGKHVIGVLPLSLAAFAAKVTEIPLSIPLELRGKELGVEDVRHFAGRPVTYSVKTLTE